MNTTDTEAPSEEGRSEEEPCSNHWEKLARVYFPQYTPVGEGRYSVLAMEIEALHSNLICHRFSSMREMAEWLSAVLGWTVDGKHLRTYIERFKCRSTEREDPEQYTMLCAIFARENQFLIDEDRKKLKNIP